MLDILIVRGKFGAGLSKVVDRLLDKHPDVRIKIIKSGQPQPEDADVLCYWGVATAKRRYTGKHILNHPDNVFRVSDKLRFYNDYYYDIQIPFHSENSTQLFDGLVVCRTKSNSHGGDGVSVVEASDGLPPAKYYSEYVEGIEYRVHYARGIGILDVAQKKKMTTAKLKAKGIEFDPYVRSHSRGWVHSHKNIAPIEHVVEKIEGELRLIELDFFAADIRVTEDIYALLEVNTAPGLMQTSTIYGYVKMLDSWIT